MNHASKTENDLDDLLAHRAWLGALARRLVSDAHLAQDLEQETWAAALQSPPRDRVSPRGWLARVLRRRLADFRRSSARRSAREALSLPPTGAEAPDDLVARSQRSADLLQAVVELPEAYRVVVLARFFEGLGNRSIATRLGVPESTVRTRSTRALERLRIALDARYGTRAAWVLALSSQETTTAATTGLTTLAGGLAMTVKTQTLAAAALVAIGVATGWFGARSVSADAQQASHADEADVAPVSDDWPAGAVQAVRQRDRQIARLERELQTRQAKTTAESAEVAVGDQAQESTSTDAAVAAAETEKALSEPIELEEHVGLLAGVDWVAFARHSMSLIKTLAEVSQSLREDGTIPSGAEAAVQRDDRPIADILRPVAKKLPGVGPKSAANHPAFLGNALAAVLEHAGKPLTSDQRADLERQMKSFEARDHRRTRAYDDTVPKLRRMIEDGALRREFADAAFGLLTPAQLDLVRPASVRGRVRLDMLSTGLFWSDHVEPVRLAARESLADALSGRVLALLQVPRDDYDGITSIVSGWLVDHPDVDSPAAADSFDRLGLFRLERVAQLASAQLELWSRLERGAELDKAALERLRSATNVLVPLRSAP